MTGAWFTGQLSRRRLAGWGLLTVLGLALVAGIGNDTSIAAREEGKAALPADLARIPTDAFFISSIRMAHIWNSDAAKGLREEMTKAFPDMFQEFEKALGVGIPDIERLTMVVHGIQGDSEPIFVIVTTKPYDKEKLLDKALKDRETKEVKSQVLFVGKKDRKAISFLDGSTLAVGDPRAMEWFLEQPGNAKEGPQTAVLQAAAGKHALVAGFNPAPAANVIEMLPAEAEPFKPLLAAQSSLLTVDLGEKVSAEVRGTFANADDAEKAEKAAQAVKELGLGFLDQSIKDIQKRGKDWEKIVDLLRVAEEGLRNAKLTRRGTVVQASTGVQTDLAVLHVALVQAVQKIREASKRIQSQNNLKQIALAMHNYHDATGSFPPAAIFDANGKPMLSWRVLVLPYIEQDELYKEFHLDEAWDSEHNKKLLERMPKIYETVEGDAKKGFLTRYLGFSGKDAFFDGAKGIRITDITDGTSNTIMVVEARQGVPWSKPDDIPFDNGKLVPRVGGVFKDGFNAAYCDGSVHFHKLTIKEETLRALVTRNGGEVIADDGD